MGRVGSAKARPVCGAAHHLLLLHGTISHARSATPRPGPPPRRPPARARCCTTTSRARWQTLRWAGAAPVLQPVNGTPADGVHTIQPASSSACLLPLLTLLPAPVCAGQDAAARRRRVRQDPGQLFGLPQVGVAGVLWVWGAAGQGGVLLGWVGCCWAGWGGHAGCRGID